MAGALRKPYFEKEPLLHAKKDRKHHTADYRQPVYIETDSLIAKVLRMGEEKTVYTNSFHHQTVHPDKPGRHLRITARTVDGIVEAIEAAQDSPWARSGRFVLGRR